VVGGDPVIFMPWRGMDVLEDGASYSLCELHCVDLKLDKLANVGIGAKVFQNL